MITAAVTTAARSYEPDKQMLHIREIIE